MSEGVITAGNCMFKVNSRNTKTRCKICSKLIKTPERRHHSLFLWKKRPWWCCSGVFIVNFEHISTSVSIVNFEQVNVGWDSFIVISNGYQIPKASINPFKRQPHKMVKHTQTIRRQKPLKRFKHPSRSRPSFKAPWYSMNFRNWISYAAERGKRPSIWFYHISVSVYSFSYTCLFQILHIWPFLGSITWTDSYQCPLDFNTFQYSASFAAEY